MQRRAKKGGFLDYEYEHATSCNVHHDAASLPKQNVFKKMQRRAKKGGFLDYEYEHATSCNVHHDAASLPKQNVFARIFW